MIKALLGPTNTGKTHRAVRRMLGHRSGMIGLPLRLLAQEVYDRVAAEVGPDKVALVTGEERRIPHQPRYWVATTESMPLNRAVDFVAVDELQLCTHPERGHVFTDRMLRARGMRETWFMGAETIRERLVELVPTVDIDTFPRLSQLKWAGTTKLEALPPRTAIVAFSVARVMDLAERVRRRRGGAAVVMGALSPRARNAQVAMYQSGEVDFIVATDAIGMGLNMNVRHVALGATRKFDGRVNRALEPSELAQIAGRAGRYKTDGSFGLLDGADPLHPEVVADIEQHRFEQIRQVRWRNPDLCWDSARALVESLRDPPPRRWMRPPRDPVDQATLARLAARPEVAALARGETAVRLLWEVACVPDFRRTLEGSHVQLLADVYGQLMGPKAILDPDWVRPRIARLGRTEGDIGLLMTRIAFIRTWTYIAHRADWLADAEDWQAQARQIEDRLSDALHEQLTQRFVDQRTMVLLDALRRPEPLQAHVAEDGAVTAMGQALGSLQGFAFETARTQHPEQAAALRRAARAGLAAQTQDRLAALLAAPDGAFRLGPDARIRWQEVPLARLRKGPSLRTPKLELAPLNLLSGPELARVRHKLEAWMRRQVDAVLSPLLDPPHLRGPLRGLLFRLAEGLGTLPRASVLALLGKHPARTAQQLRPHQVSLGRHFVYARALLGPEAMLLRAVLWSIHTGQAMAPHPGAPSQEDRPRRPPEDWLAQGYALAGPHVLRVDLLETALARLRGLAKGKGRPLPPDFWPSLQIPPAHQAEVLAYLGFWVDRAGRVRPQGLSGRRRSSA